MICSLFPVSSLQIQKATCAFSKGYFIRLSFCMRCSPSIKCPCSSPLPHAIHPLIPLIFQSSLNSPDSMNYLNIPGRSSIPSSSSSSPARAGGASMAARTPAASGAALSGSNGRAAQKTFRWAGDPPARGGGRPGAANQRGRGGGARGAGEAPRGPPRRPRGGPRRRAASRMWSGARKDSGKRGPPRRGTERLRG